MSTRAVALAAGVAILTPAGVALAQAPEPAAAPRTIVLSLEDALALAVGESETVWVAEAGVARAVGQETVARSGLFPQVGASFSYVRTLASQFEDIDFGGPPDDGNGGEDPGDGNGGFEDLPFGRANQYTLGLSLSQIVFDAGQTAARIRAAEAGRRSAEVDVESARAQTLLDATRAYFDALLSDRLVDISRGTLERTEEVLRQTEVARRVGDRSEFELLRARVERDNLRPVLIRRETDRSEAYLRLKQLLNLPLDERLALTTGVETVPARFTTASDPAAERRAPVRQALEQVEATEARLAEVRGQRLPSVALSSRYAPVAFPESGLPEPGDFREDWTVTLSVSVPLLTWGRIAGLEAAARGDLSAARARLQQTREAAALDARVARDELARAEAQLAATSSTAEEASRAYSIAQIRFREGIASQIELADSRLLLEQSEVNRALALRDVQVARARLALLEDLPLGGTVGGGAPPGTLQQQPVTPQPQAQPQTQTVTAGVPGGFDVGGQP